MLFVSCVVILAIILAYADDKKAIKNGLTLSFWLIVAVFSMRYGYGNDYKAYEEWFNSIISFSSIANAIHQRSDIEPGWVVLNYLCGPIGFQAVITITTFVSVYIYYCLVKKYVPRPYRWVGILIYLMYPNLFVLNLSMIRQGLAGAMFLLSFIKGYEGKWKQSVILCLLAISVHQVALICIPFIIMINFKKYLNPKYLVLIVIFIFIVFLFNHNLVESLFARVMSNDMAYGAYSNYLTREGSKDVSLALFARIVVVVPSIIWYKKLTELDKYLTMMFCLSPFMILFSTQVVLVLRLECFFLPFAAIIFPRLLLKDYVFVERPKNWTVAKPVMIVATCGWVFFTVRSYFNFFSEPTYAEHFASFHTIFTNVF